MLTKASLALLDALSAGREATPDELATEAGYSQNHMVAEVLILNT